MRCRINEKAELVTRDGRVLGKIDAISLDLYVDLGGKGGTAEEAKGGIETPPPPSEDDGRLFAAPSARVQLAEHWRLRSGRELKLSDSKVRTVLDNALKARELDVCKSAIDGLFADPWWKENVRTLELRHALRGNTARGESDADRIDKMAEKAPENFSSLESYLASLSERDREDAVTYMRNATVDVREERDATPKLRWLSDRGIHATIEDGRITDFIYRKETE